MGTVAARYREDGVLSPTVPSLEESGHRLAAVAGTSTCHIVQVELFITFITICFSLLKLFFLEPKWYFCRRGMGPIQSEISLDCWPHILIVSISGPHYRWLVDE